MALLIEAVHQQQIWCLIKAQEHIAQLLEHGFGLPDDVALDIQEIRAKIPELIKRIDNVTEEVAYLSPAGKN